MPGRDRTGDIGLFFRHFPCDHGVMLPSGAVMLDARAETANSTVISETRKQSDDIVLRNACFTGNIRIRSESIRQVGLHDAQNRFFLFRKSHGPTIVFYLSLIQKSAASRPPRNRFQACGINAAVIFRQDFREALAALPLPYSRSGAIQRT